MKSFTAFLLFLIFSSSAMASDFFPYNWTKGMHLFAGVGAHTALFSDQEGTYDGGLGLNLKTDVTYFIDEDWAIELGSSVGFNRVSNYLLWDTLFTVGVRVPLPSLTQYQLGQPYGRLFVGRAPTVLFLNGDHTRVDNGNVDRIQWDGPVIGGALGTLHMTAKGQVWFTEFSFAYQELKQQTEIGMAGEVPVIISDGNVDGHSSVYSLSFTIGIMAF
ncbi:hypothetical protein [Bdellovibrio sp. HCB274]|uniref:hypothetical protein n=1 Tax=Bdellovibrio sp. HCB274 TaxID=3394361 RepID=UPI0039B6BB21